MLLITRFEQHVSRLNYGYSVGAVLKNMLFASIVALLLSGCDQKSATYQGPEYAAKPVSGKTLYLLAIHPLHNPAKLISSYQPLVDYLDRNMEGVHFEIEASRDYQDYERKLRARGAAFILPNPWQTLQAMTVGFTVIAQAGNPDDFSGIFIIRKDSEINKPADLRGKIVSYPSHTALAACIMPQYFLHQQGLDVNKDIDNRYVGSQESSIMYAYLKQSAAAATWPPPWRAFQKDHPEEAAQLKVIWSTPPLLNNSVMARDDVPEIVRNRVAELLTHLHETKQGQEILTAMQTAQFHVASNETYAPVQKFVDHFEHEVRPVEQP